MTRLTKTVVRTVPFRNGQKGGLVVSLEPLQGGDAVIRIREYRRRGEAVSVSTRGLYERLLREQIKNTPKGFTRMKV